MATFSVTHWWSHWEVIEQVAVQFGDVLPFLRKEGLGSATTMAKLIQFFTDPQKKALFEVEIATTIHWERPFVTATYSLEGDGSLALHYSEKIEMIKAAIHTAHTPNLDAIARRLSTSAEKAYCRGHFLLHIPKDQHLQARH